MSEQKTCGFVNPQGALNEGAVNEGAVNVGMVGVFFNRPVAVRNSAYQL